MEINTLKIKLQELESNLENIRVQEILRKEEFDLNNLNTSIKNYNENIEQIQDAHLLNTINTKIQELINYSNNSSFQSYSHQFINAANFLIKNTPKKLGNIKDESTDINSISISEEKFSERYNKLIAALNFEDEECNLILETPSEKRAFKVYKTKTNSLAIYAKDSVKPMIIGTDRFIEVAFKRKEPTYPSYEVVLISKIMDNSIFDYFTKSEDDVMSIIANHVRNHSIELLSLNNKLEILQKENGGLATIKQELSEILTESKNAKSEFISATKAAVAHTKLKASVSYWDIKQKIHKSQFWIYSVISIVLMVGLIFALGYIYNHLSDLIDIDNIVKTNILDNNKTSILELNKDNIPNSFAYIHFIGLYALLIFASSSAVWIIRLIVKIALSNLHLSEDAHERVVMIKTYLSFIQEAHGLAENDKQLILSSIFRPSSIGIIKDESSITVADIVSSLKNK